MNLKTAIEKAIEGGYGMFGFAEKPLFSWSMDKYWGGWLICVRFGSYGQKSIDETIQIESKYNDFNIDKILLDSFFWQNLGKIMKWESKWIYVNNKDEMMSQNGWLYFWHRFIDHLAEGKSIESFFETL